MNSPRRSRRQFLKTGCITAASAAMLPYLHADTPKKKLFSAIGSSAPLEKAAMIKAAGGEFITEGVSSFLIPDQDEAAFEKNLQKLKASPLPILACNSFLRPTHLRCVGADANHDQVLAWADIAFRRLKRADGKIIVFGSSGARQLRDDWPKEKADEQFVALLKKMGPLAEAQGITVTVEQLHAKECNYINRIGEAATLVRAAGHPNIRVLADLADLYHMAVMDDTPEDLKAALDVVHHLEIAEKADRTMPGVAGDDFRPFFRVLREGGYQGAVSIEGNWDESQFPKAFQELTKQAAEV